MRRTLQLVLLAVLLGSAGLAETVDRIVVVVNKRIILASEWDQAVRFEALADHKDLATITAVDCAHALDRLIDQELLEQQIATTTYQPASAEELAKAVASVRQQILPAGSDEDWHALLARYGLAEDDVEDRVRVVLDIERFIDLRFRPNIHIDPRTIEAYYRNTLMPRIEAQHGQMVSLKDASKGIEDELVQERINEGVSEYLKTLRSQSHIQRMTVPAAAREGQEQ
jgi:hypothetical protein